MKSNETKDVSMEMEGASDHSAELSKMEMAMRELYKDNPSQLERIDAMFPKETNRDANGEKNTPIDGNQSESNISLRDWVIVGPLVITTAILMINGPVPDTIPVACSSGVFSFLAILGALKYMERNQSNPNSSVTENEEDLNDSQNNT